MEKTLKEFAGPAASLVVERWRAMDADRRSRSEPDGLDESIEVTMELVASDGHSESSVRVAILDSAE